MLIACTAFAESLDAADCRRSSDKCYMGPSMHTQRHDTVMVHRDDGSTETKLMLSPEEEVHTHRGDVVEVPYNSGAHHDGHHHHATTQQHSHIGVTPTSPQKPAKKKLEFSMASKIQIIPNNRQGQLNTGYLSTLGGLLKVAEIVLSFMAFVLAICADRRTTTAAWTEHIAFECVIGATLLLLGYVCFPHLTLHDQLTKEGLVVVELLFYGVNTLFYFISIWLMVHLSATWGADGRGAAIMSAIVCVALTVIFAAETYMKGKTWRGESETSSRTVTAASA